jgi:hypothetical protein
MGNNYVYYYWPILVFFFYIFSLLIKRRKFLGPFLAGMEGSEDFIAGRTQSMIGTRVTTMSPLVKPWLTLHTLCQIWRAPRSWVIGHRLYSYSKNPHDFTQPECSVPRSQELSISDYPEPDQSSPHHSILSLSKIYLNVIHPPTDYWCMRQFIPSVKRSQDRHCSLVGEVPDYRSRGPGFDSQRYQSLRQVVDLE